MPILLLPDYDYLYKQSLKEAKTGQDCMTSAMQHSLPVKKVWHWYICLHSFLSLSSLNVWMHHSSGSEINYSFNFLWFPFTFYWASEQQFHQKKFRVWACYDLELWLHFIIILSFSENPRPAPRRRPRLYDKAFADRDSDAEVKDLPSENVTNQAFY